MLVLMMNVGKMRMTVTQGDVAVFMSMRLEGIQARFVIVAVMGIVNM